MPGIILLWLFRGYPKEASEGHWDAASLCHLKNVSVKLVWRTDEGDGEEESEAVEEKAKDESLSSWLTLLSMRTIYADIMQMFIWSV